MQRKNKELSDLNYDTGDRRRLSELNVLSGIAIICVVLIHSNAGYLLSVLKLKEYTDAGFSVRLLDNFIHGAVPLFIFIAGYKYALNNVEDEYKTYFYKKITRVAKPFIVLSVIFLIRDIILYTDEYSSLKSMILQLFKICVGNDNPAYHLWYIPMYLFITLTYPFIYKKCKSDKLRSFFIIFIVFIHLILGMKIPLALERPFNYVYYYLFFEMGIIFCKYRIKERLYRYRILFLFLYIGGAVVLTINPIPDLYTVMQSYLLWPMSITAYYFLSISLCNSKLLNYLGEYSFYIFLLHEPLILSKIFRLINGMGIYNSQIWVFIVCIFTFIFTVILYKIIEKTPIRRWLFY